MNYGYDSIKIFGSIYVDLPAVMSFVICCFSLIGVTKDGKLIRKDRQPKLTKKDRKVQYDCFPIYMYLSITYGGT